MANFLITGGAGFIGSNIALELAKNGHEVLCFDNLSTGKKTNIYGSRNIKLVLGDITDKTKLSDAMENMDFVIHNAALISVDESIRNPSNYNHVNINGTINVLESAVKQGVKKIILASSSAIYGDNTNMPLSEEEIPKPISPYAITKITTEYYFNLFNRLYGINTACLRYFNVYGPRQDVSSPYAAVIPKFIKLLLNKKQPTIFGDGNQTRDFVFIKDVVNANLLACNSKVNGESINIASGKTVSLNELYKSIADLLGTKIKPIYSNERKGDIKHSSANIQKAKKSLLFNPSYNLRDGLKETIEWYTKNEK